MQAKRDEIAEKSDGAAEYAKDWLECGACQQRTTEPERASMDCGWLPESKRRPGLLRAFPEASVCPGYLIQQPEVYEAARARRWRAEGGSLRDLYDDPLNPALRDAIDIMDAACSEVDREHMRKQRREMSRGSQ